jgi:hypothetical protein
MVLKKWRQRRASIRELRANPDDTYKEYLKLCAQDKQRRANQPPAYQDVLRGSGDSLSSSGSQGGLDGRSRGSTIASSMGGSRPATLMEEPEERTNGR